MQRRLLPVMGVGFWVLLRKYKMPAWGGVSKASGVLRKCCSGRVLLLALIP